MHHLGFMKIKSPARKDINPEDVDLWFDFEDGAKLVLKEKNTNVESCLLSHAPNGAQRKKFGTEPFPRRKIQAYRSIKPGVKRIIVMEKYLTVNELSSRIKMSPGTIRNLVWQKKLIIGVHYLKPTPRKLLFIWSAVESWLWGDRQVPATTESDDRCLIVIDDQAFDSSPGFVVPRKG